MPVKFLKSLQLGLEMVAAMPVHSLVYDLLHGIPVWLEVGLALVAFALLVRVVSMLRRGERQRTKRTPKKRMATEVIVIEPSGNVKKVAVENHDILVVKPAAKARKARANAADK